MPDNLPFPHASLDSELWRRGVFEPYFAEQLRERRSSGEDSQAAPYALMRCVPNALPSHPVIQIVHFLGHGAIQSQELDLEVLSESALANPIVSKLVGTVLFGFPQITEDFWHGLDREISIGSAVPVKDVATLQEDDLDKIQTASVWGEVIDHTAKALVVRFDVAGVREDREFFWDEINAKPDDLPKGTAVLGRTELIMAPKEDESLSDAGRLKSIREATHREMRSMGIEPGEVGSRMLVPEPLSQDSVADVPSAK